jgi:hypothetical protein
MTCFSSQSKDDDPRAKYYKIVSAAWPTVTSQECLLWSRMKLSTPAENSNNSMKWKSEKEERKLTDLRLSETGRINFKESSLDHTCPDMYSYCIRVAASSML